MRTLISRTTRGAIAAFLAALCLAMFSPAQAQDALQSRLKAYADRVARLEDADAVETLQATFGYYFDKGLWEDAADLFAKTGSFEYGLSGVYIGQDHIRRAMQQRGGAASILTAGCLFAP